MSVLEKVKRLEKYIAIDSATVDPVISMAIDKLLAREVTRMLEVKARLGDQLKEFEEKYSLNSSGFYTRYKKGEMGDDMDFIEWAATVEMVENAEKRLALLNKESYS